MSKTNFKKLSALGHNYKLPKLIKFLDSYYYDLTELRNPVIYPKDLLLKPIDISEENIKEQYHLKEDPNMILRFDHTFPMFISEYSLRNQNVRNVGPVFRNDYRHLFRWREFNQYDVDYLYEDHRLRPLEKAITIVKRLKIPYKLLVNDLTMIRSILNTEVTENNVSNLLENKKDFDLVSYEESFYEKYPSLKDANVLVDPHLIRGWNYYTDLVFEFVYDKVSFAAGGIYLNKNEDNQSAYIGLSFGLDRILGIQKKQHIEDFKEPVVLVYYIEECFPSKLLDQMEKEKVNYVLKVKKKNLKADYKKIASDLAKVDKHIINTVIIGRKEISENKYFFKDKHTIEKEYSCEELVQKLKSNLLLN